MKIIDCAKKGNVVRFFLGKDDLTEWWGDDWNDCPYDCNAGEVYDKFISGHRDISFPFDDLVLEPCDGAYNCEYCKDDMIARKIPCIIVVPKKLVESDGYWDDNFKDYIGRYGITKFYFGDQMDNDND